MSNALRDNAIIALRKYGFGPGEIARKMELSAGVVSGVLFRADLTAKPSTETVAPKRGRGRHFTVDTETRNRAVAMSWRKTLRETAEAFGVSPATIVYWRQAA